MKSGPRAISSSWKRTMPESSLALRVAVVAAHRALAARLVAGDARRVHRVHRLRALVAGCAGGGRVILDPEVVALLAGDARLHVPRVGEGDDGDVRIRTNEPLAQVIAGDEIIDPVNRDSSTRPSESLPWRGPALGWRPGLRLCRGGRCCIRLLGIHLPCDKQEGERNRSYARPREWDCHCRTLAPRNKWGNTNLIYHKSAMFCN